MQDAVNRIIYIYMELSIWENMLRLPLEMGSFQGGARKAFQETLAGEDEM